MTDDDHRVLRESLGAYVLGHLDGTESARVRAHRDGCVSCRSEYESLAPLAVALRDVDPAALERVDEPGRALGRRIETEVAAGRVRHRRRALPRQSVVVVAASLLLVLAFVAGSALTGDGTSPVPLQAVRVTSEVAGVQARADLVDHTWGVEIKLKATGLEDGAAYTTTVAGADGREHPAGEFLGVADGEIRCNMNASVLLDDATGFTVWDSTGEPVLRADLSAAAAGM